MSPDLGKARALQQDLADMTTDLAQLISVPALSRDTDAIRGLWDDICRCRAPLNALYRKLRKIARDMGKSIESRALHDEVRALNRCLQLWTEIGHMVAHHIEMPETAFDLDFVAAPHDPLISYLYSALHTLANPNQQHESAVDHDCFADIPMDIQRFEMLIFAAYRLLLVQGRADTARFLDVGCGGATKVFAATRVFPKCDGLEYDPGYAEAGERCLQLIAPEAGCVMQSDALAFEDYANYDVIYFYRPISDDEMLSEMQARIVEQARPGTVILAPYTHWLDPRDDFPAAQIKGPIYVTGVTQQEADVWHANARRTAPDLIRRARHLRYDPGFWTPLLAAASYNGATQLDAKLLPSEVRYDGFKAAVT